MEFKPFPKINRLNNTKMSITQKIHGSNAQILITEADHYHVMTQNSNVITVGEKHYNLRCGSRTRWIAPGDDNYGFAAFVYANKEEFIEKLGVGQHFGEWAGPGINSGEGLKEKTFVLFNWWEFPPERLLPPQCAVVPLLYEGPFSMSKIEEVSNDLKTNGSKLVPGFLRPEGIVINVLGHLVKSVFEAEETQWKKPSKIKSPKVNGPDVSSLLQPIRMEKLLSKDSQYILDFPKSINTIKEAYIKDLSEEGAFESMSPEVASGMLNALHKEIYPFIKQMVFEQTNIEGK